MDEEQARTLNEMVEKLEAGRVSLQEAAARVKGLEGESIAASMMLADSAVERMFEGRLSADQAEAVVREQADLHPICSRIFILLVLIALERKGPAEDIIGYVALTMIKDELYSEGELVELFEEQPDLAFMLPLIEGLGEEMELSTVWPYLEQPNRHLIKHFLLQDTANPDCSLSHRELEIIFSRRAEMAPLLLNLVGDIVDFTGGERQELMDPVTLLGYFRVREAVPVLTELLEVGLGVVVHEALLALVKIGSESPGEVSSILKSIVSDCGVDMARLAALEALGYLWNHEGNLEYLFGVLEALDTGMQDVDSFYACLVDALLCTGAPGVGERLEVESERLRRALDPETIDEFGSQIEEYEPFEDQRIAFLRNEDVVDVLLGTMDLESERKRQTLTLERELELEMSYDDLLDSDEFDMFASEPLEESPRGQLEPGPRLSRTVGRNEPCPCGSGKKFKKCCLPRLEAEEAGLSAVRPLLITAEGDRVVECSATYEVEDPGALAEALLSIPGVEEEGGGDAGGARRFVWTMSPAIEAPLREGTHVGPQMEPSAAPGPGGRVLGWLNMGPDRLQLKTDSLERLEAGKAELARSCGRLLTHLDDERGEIL